MSTSKPIGYRSRSELSDKKFFKVGLDFGTTKTAGVFCLVSDDTRYLKGGDVHAFKRYPDSESERQEANTQTPSVVRYEQHAMRTGLAALRNSGLPGITINLMKLGLLEQPQFANVRQRLFSLLEQLRKEREHDNDSYDDEESNIETDTFDSQTARHARIMETLEHVITDFFCGVFSSWKAELEDVGYNERDSLELHCAVPADWRGGGPLIRLGKTIDRAAEQAGLRFCKAVKYWTEPEAALGYLMKHNSKACFRVSYL